MKIKGKVEDKRNTISIAAGFDDDGWLSRTNKTRRKCDKSGDVGHSSLLV